MKLRSSGARDSGFRLHAIVRGAWIAAALIAVGGALGAGATFLTASPRLCGACHEMAPKVAAWSTGAHAQVGCPACHETPRPWYRFPDTLAARGVALKRDLVAHWANRAENSAIASIDGTTTVPDSICLRCHNPSRAITMRSGTLRSGTIIKHTEHAKRNKSCTSCHLYTAHPAPKAERSLLLMAQCFTCHGRTITAKAPGTCGVCHPSSFRLRPESHAPPTSWLARHGKIAVADRQQCVMCHEESFCRDCHGVEMPHPQTWAKGTPGHAAVAEKNRQACSMCHQERPDLCSMCHHKEFDTTKGTWVAQHPAMVKQRGASFCMECHVVTFCIHCHTTGRIAEEPSIR